MHIEKSLRKYRALNIMERCNTYLDERVACNIPTREGQEPLVDIRAFQDGCLILHPSLPSPLVRKGLAERIIQVAHLLATQGFHLEILELHREIQKQQQEFDAIWEHMKTQHPTLLHEQLWEMTTQFIADPSLCPPHTTGGACDVRLRHADSGYLVDMGTEMNSITNEAALMSDNISEEAKRHRRILLDAFLKAGCAPMASEWWHYSYGEKYWAAFYDMEALYDIVA